MTTPLPWTEMLLDQPYIDQMRDATGEQHDQPKEPTDAFANRAEGKELWCHVCDQLTTYDELHRQAKTLDARYFACPTCGLFATVQDIT